MLAGNNDRLLSTREDLGADDMSAMVDRILYLETPKAAGEYLASIGGPATVNAWITEDKIAQHALHLRDTRKVDTSGRLLVMGNPTEFHDRLAIGAGATEEVAEWLVRYISTTPMGTMAREGSSYHRIGGGEAWISASALSATEKSWSNYVRSSQHPPTAKKIGQALKLLSSDYRQMGKSRIRMHKIRLELLCRWADDTRAGESEIIMARANQPLTELRIAT
jgi:hypothetical protein